jgi:hypothetical protein
VKLVLRAREETLTGRNARPFAYPGASERYFDVTLDPSTPIRPLKVDGLQTGQDDLGEPLFEELSRPGTGHPAARVSGWAKTDGESLYAALDFTVDNTLDGDKDWAALLVRSGGSFREFRVTANDPRWGVAGFTRTGRAHYTHKYYEFKIPLSEIAAADEGVLQLRFQAYGTAAILDSNPELLPSFGEVLWVPNERTLLYASSFQRPRERGDLSRRGQPQEIVSTTSTLFNALLRPRDGNLLRSSSTLSIAAPVAATSVLVAVVSANLTAD